LNQIKLLTSIEALGLTKLIDPCLLAWSIYLTGNNPYCCSNTIKIVVENLLDA